MKETKDHLKHAGDELFKLFKRGVVQRLIIGTPRRDARRGRAHAAQLPARADRGLDRHRRPGARPPRSRSEAAAIIERDERDREREWLDRLQSELGRNARGVAGLADTLEALNERRVEALLVQDGFRAEGYARRRPTSSPPSPAAPPPARSCRSATT